MDDSRGKNGLLVDATDLLLGRMASLVAKCLLLGKTVTIINAEKAVISGKREKILEERQSILRTRTLGSKRKSPKHPRRPDGILRLVVRRMLPMDKPRGKEAFSNLRVYIGVPGDIDVSKAETLPEARRREGTHVMRLEALAKSIGWGEMEE
ncbi:MAG: 50S ribosomal protein L13 [Candidatus Bathyarchaeia archaeon]